MRLLLVKNIKYPTLSESIEQWKVYSEVLLKAISGLEEATLKKELNFTLPSGGTTIEDALVFMVLHETYHIGQISLIRKMLGYPSMKLGRRK